MNALDLDQAAQEVNPYIYCTGLRSLKWRVNVTQIKKILLATDGSEQAQKATRFASDLARATGASLHILTSHSEELLNMHLVGAGGWPGTMTTSAISIDELRESIEKTTETDVLDEAIRISGSLAETPSASQVWGQAAEVICRYAEENDINLIVIGSRGRSGFARLLLGSISNQVVNHAKCPVTVVH